MEKAVVFETPPTKQGVEGMHGLLPGDGSGVGAVEVRGTLRG